MAVKRTVNVKDLPSIFAAKQNILSAIDNALTLHGEAIQSEIDGFDLLRKANPDGWAKLCVIKAILSPGANLDANIRAAKQIFNAMQNGANPQTFDDVKDLLDGAAYGTQCYGNNVRALLASWHTIQCLTASCMGVNELRALIEAKYLVGLGNKTMRWALALYDASNCILTLDRHMLRGILSLAGDNTDAELSINDKTYAALEYFLTETIMDSQEYDDVPFLCIQWALWNEFRHPGQHASHAALTF